MWQQTPVLIGTCFDQDLFWSWGLNGEESSIVPLIQIAPRILLHSHKMNPENSMGGGFKETAQNSTNGASSGGASLHHGSFLAYKQDFPRLPTSYERLCVNIQSDKFEDISISSKPVYSNDHNLRHDQTFRFATLIKHQCNHIQCNVSAHTAVQLRTLHWFAPELLVILAGST